MKRRSGFTLMEILIVVGIIVLLIGILLPVLSHVRKQSNITLQKLDFQTISTALEAYHQDFGDYPRNNTLTSWTADGAGGFEAPPFLSLATALIGPEPATWQNQGGLVAGDGANGGGFRALSTINAPCPLQAPVSVGSITVQVTTVPLAWQTMTLAQLQDTFALTNVILSPGTDHQEIIGLAQPAAILSIPYVVQMNFAATYNHPQTPPPPGEGFAIFVTAKGKIWPSYLPPDKFKVVFIQVPTALGIPTVSSPQGQPVILDRWNGVIQYFPRYGPNTNRIYTNPPPASSANSSYTPVPSPPAMVGPLYGYSTPASLYSATPTPAYGLNSIYDQRDGAPVLNSSGGYVESWTAASTMDVPPKPLNLGLAIQWMLGDDDPGVAQDNLITAAAGEHLHYDGNYILISGGPDGPDRSNGGFCNMANLTDPASRAKAFQTSGNIYNFDR